MLLNVTAMAQHAANAALPHCPCDDMPPRSFLVFATALIGVVHLYIGARLLPDLPVTHLWKLLGAVWLLASSVLVPVGLLARGIKQQPLSDRLSWIGLMAMGFFS